MTSQTLRRRRPRDPEASRAAILAAARAAFTELGYGQASIREIAHRADTANGLVLRHFGTKEELFFAAFAETIDSGMISQQPRPALEDMVGRVISEDPTASPFLALIRSAEGPPAIAAALRDRLRSRASDTILEQLVAADDPAEIHLRVDLLGALLIGVTFARHILGSSPLAEATSDELRALLNPVIDAALGAGRLDEDAGGTSRGPE